MFWKSLAAAALAGFLTIGLLISHSVHQRTETIQEARQAERETTIENLNTLLMDTIRTTLNNAGPVYGKETAASLITNLSWGEDDPEITRLLKANVQAIWAQIEHQRITQGN